MKTIPMRPLITRGTVWISSMIVPMPSPSSDLSWRDEENER